jgi:RNA polymerase sigma-70 factor (sigma-E family)
MSDEDEFARLVTTRSRELLRAGWLLTEDWALAEDLVQSALESTWRHWASVERRDAPEAYVRRVMLTTWLRWRRRRWLGEIPTLTDHESDIAADEVVGNRDVLLVVFAALRTLSARQRAVIVLRYFNDLTEAETAIALGCSPGSVKVHSARAFAKLRQLPSLEGLLNEGSQP